MNYRKSYSKNITRPFNELYVNRKPNTAMMTPGPQIWNTPSQYVSIYSEEPSFQTPHYTNQYGDRRYAPQYQYNINQSIHEPKFKCKI